MGRTIRTGSEVLVVARGEPRVGEVWAFCNNEGTLVVHRLLRRRHELFHFQGDAHWPDAPVPREHLVGRVVRVRHDGKERRLGPPDRLVGGVRLLLRERARAAVRRLGGRRRRRFARWLLGRRPR